MKTRNTRIAYTAMLSALGVVLLLIGSFFSMLDLTVAALASLLIALITVEFGKGMAMTAYLLTAILALLLCPQKNAAVFYTFFFGAYPVWKSLCEQRRIVLSVILKELFYLLTFLCVMFVTDRLLVPWIEEYPWWYVLAIGVAGNLVFWLYDVALGRLIAQYVWRWRARLPFSKIK